MADIVVASARRPGLVRGSWLKPGSVVVDAGYGQGLHGDVRRDEALEVVSLLAPVPGGVGPMTIAVLLERTVRMAERSRPPTGSPGGGEEPAVPGLGRAEGGDPACWAGHLCDHCGAVLRRCASAGMPGWIRCLTDGARPLAIALVTPWSRTLGLRAPVLNAPMGGVAGGRLAAAVSSAGGLGMIGVGSAGSATVLEEEVAVPRADGREIRDRTPGLGDRGAPGAPGCRAGGGPGAPGGELRRGLDLGGTRQGCRDRDGHAGCHRRGGGTCGWCRDRRARGPWRRRRGTRDACGGHSAAPRRSSTQCRSRYSPREASQQHGAWLRYWRPGRQGRGSERRSPHARSRGVGGCPSGADRGFGCGHRHHERVRHRTRPSVARALPRARPAASSGSDGTVVRGPCAKRCVGCRGPLAPEARYSLTPRWWMPDRGWAQLWRRRRPPRWSEELRTGAIELLRASAPQHESDAE